MGENGLSAADIAAISGNENGWGGMIWLFAILALMGGGFGGWNNRGYEQYATAQSVAAANQVYHDVVEYVGDKYSELQRDVAGLAIGQANLLAHQNECCGGITRQLMQNNYDAAMRDAATNANIVAQSQKILDAIIGNKIEAMQNRINQLELQNQLQGVVRYPNGWTYNAGTSPFCGGCNM